MRTAKGGIYNFVTKRGQCRGDRSKISWTQVETGSAITWKYPSCVLLGADSVGEFYSVALTNNRQQAGHRHQDDPCRPAQPFDDCEQGDAALAIPPTATAGLCRSGPRRWVRRTTASGDSMLIGDQPPPTRTPTSAPSSRTRRWSTKPVPVASLPTSSFYLQSRGIGFEAAVSMMVSGLLPRCVQPVADGICRRSRQAARPQTRRFRRLNALTGFLPL